MGGLVSDAWILYLGSGNDYYSDYNDRAAVDSGKMLMFAYFSMLLMNAVSLQRKYREGKHMLQPIKLVQQVVVISCVCLTFIANIIIWVFSIGDK